MKRMVILLFSGLATSLCAAQQVPPGAFPSQIQPTIIYQPQVVYRPYQLQSIQRHQIQYPTPLRRFFFGSFRYSYQYQPMPSQLQYSTPRAEPSQ